MNIKWLVDSAEIATLQAAALEQRSAIRVGIITQTELENTRDAAFETYTTVAENIHSTPEEIAAALADSDAAEAAYQAGLETFQGIREGFASIVAKLAGATLHESALPQPENLVREIVFRIAYSIVPIF